eukprot:288499_1
MAEPLPLAHSPEIPFTMSPPWSTASINSKNQHALISTCLIWKIQTRAQANSKSVQQLRTIIYGFSGEYVRVHGVPRDEDEYDPNEDMADANDNDNDNDNDMDPIYQNAPNIIIDDGADNISDLDEEEMNMRLQQQQQNNNNNNNIRGDAIVFDEDVMDIQAQQIEEDNNNNIDEDNNDNEQKDIQEQQIEEDNNNNIDEDNNDNEQKDIQEQQIEEDN